MDFSTSTSSLHHNHHNHHLSSTTPPASSRARAAASASPHKSATIHRSASASALIAGGGASSSSSSSRGAFNQGAPPVPNIPLFHRNNTTSTTNTTTTTTSSSHANLQLFPPAPPAANSFAGSRPESAKLTIDTSLSNAHLHKKQNRSISDTAVFASNPFQSSSSNRNRPPAAGDGALSIAKGTRTRRVQDRHELVPPSDIGFRNSLVDNLLLDFDKLGQDFSCDPVFDKFLDPFYSNTGNVEDIQGDTYAYRDHDYARSRLQTSYSQRKRSDSNPVANHRFYDGPHDPKQPYLGEEDESFEHNGTLVYTSDGRFITTPPQSRRGPPPSRQQAYTFEPFSDAAPTPRISNRSRAREPETPRQPNHLQRKRSTRSTKSLRRGGTDPTTEQSTLPTIHSEMQQPVESSAASPPAKPTSKPGFFRRVFGGGSGSPVPKPPPAPIAVPQPHQEDSRPAEGIKRHASVSVNPVSSGSDHVPPRTPQLMTKKSSGFFRRRKKSMSEHEPVPNLPANIAQMNQETEITHSAHPPSQSGSRPETALSRSQSRAQTSHHEREISDASILPNVVTSSPNNRNPTSVQSRRPTIRSIESELPNRTIASKEADPHADKITSAANINIDEIAAGTQTTKDMYNPPKSEPTTIQKPIVESSQPKQPKQFEGTFLRDDDSDSGNEAAATAPAKANLAAESGEPKPKSLETDRTGSTGDVFYDAASSAGRNNSVAESHTESTTMMPVVVLPHGEDDDSRQAEDVNATPRPNRTPKIAEEEFEGHPSPEEKETARKLFEGDEDFLPKSKAAAFLGEAGAPSGRIRTAYMAMFDWTSMNILAAFRGLCEKLVLKAETQQVDRIVSAVAKRWCECNPNHGFKTVDVVYTMLYSILLVNTDLHVADLQSSQRMTKPQFVKNTLKTIKRGLAGDDNDNPRDIGRCQTPYELDEPDEVHHHVPGALTKRLSFIRGPAVVQRFFDDQSTENFAHGSVDNNGTGGECGGPLVNAPFLGNMKQWEYTVESILKEFYSSIRAVALPLHGVTTADRSPDSAFAPSMLGKELRRTNSTVSKAPSESSMSLRMDRYGGSFGSSIGNSSTTRLGSKWKSNRSRPRLYPGSFAGSSRTSFDDRLWSPSASSTWSKYSLEKTATTMMSTDSLGSGFGQGDYMQSIGFANALSTAIIREETGTNGFGSDDGEQSIQPTVLDDDIDELALYGAPWAKEGMIKHKHHLESTDKRAKNRGWVECFAVVEKGWMRLFLFSSDKKKITQGIVGGGNWMENAESIGSFMLRQTLASALPPPGYSRSRPHVFALSLPNGAVHLFQCGTAEIVKEWVGTANYWSARLSKEPLVGGVSNIEYGWNNCIDLEAFAQTQSPPTTSHQPRPSFQGSMRSSIDHHGGVRARLPGDKAVIADWSPPAQSMFASPLTEADQHRALDSYVSNIEGELQKHNELRGAMLLAFTPRHPNHNKAMNNWERKSSYLLKEIVKFRTYIDALTSAAASKDRIFKEKEQRAIELTVEKLPITESSTETILPPDTLVS
ncbi:hypothetical protein H072_1402 [Dactylellina haptotyla CBS 200.50]|uniref:SEC7 domain-containing protein n=1 Tax=Dactylellina haptotyla (strain CBS 200.50) TaxID=1284197 RepID=S8AUI9_DACHA|nr:hypothetical protein H072_1402 [Dactylellina haptotyla CBS 200.50]